MKVLITGAGGFVGKNLQQHLAERKDVEVVCFTRANTAAELPRLLEGVEFVFHLAGVNRPQDPQEFVTGNADLTAALVKEALNRNMTIQDLALEKARQGTLKRTTGEPLTEADVTATFRDLRKFTEGGMVGTGGGG